MDELKIGSKFIKRIVAMVIQRALRSKFGLETEIQFNDEIKITMSDDDVFLHLNADVMCKSADFEKLISF